MIKKKLQTLSTSSAIPRWRNPTINKQTTTSKRISHNERRRKVLIDWKRKNRQLMMNPFVLSIDSSILAPLRLAIGWMFDMWRWSRGREDRGKVYWDVVRQLDYINATAAALDALDSSLQAQTKCSLFSLSINAFLNGKETVLLDDRIKSCVKDNKKRNNNKKK